jgi:predicted dehydrogenase
VARSDATARRAKEGGATAVVGGVGDLPDVDGAVVAVPAVDHAAVVDALLPREVPIFVEKPLTNDPVWARRIAAAAPDRVFVMDKWRYHPGVEMLGEIARSGEFGPVIAVESTRTGWGNPHADVDGIWHLAPHDLSIALEILGFLPDARSARADLSDGTPAGIVGLLGDDPWVRIEVGTRSTRRVRSVTVRCQEAIVSLMDGYADHLEVLVGYPPGDSPPAPTVRPISTELPLLRELRTFVAHLAGGPPPRSRVADGATVVARIAELRQLAGIGEPP